MSPPWMPLYVADYLADTGHLSTVEHGAYLLLIMHYWQSGGLPADEKKLARIARLSPREWATMRDTIAEFFGTDWQHGRIDEEIAKAEDKINKRSAAGKAGAYARYGKRTSNRMTDAYQPPSQSPEKKEEANASSKEKPRRGTRLPDGWAPTEDQTRSLMDEGFTDADHARELPRFRDYWIAKPGAGGVKLDWLATYRNWLRKSRDLGSGHKAPAASRSDSQRPSGGGLAGAGLRRELRYREMERGQQPGGDDYSANGHGAQLVQGFASPVGAEQPDAGAFGECVADGFGCQDGGAEGQRRDGRDEAGGLLPRLAGVPAGRG